MTRIIIAILFFFCLFVIQGAVAFVSPSASFPLSIAGAVLAAYWLRQSCVAPFFFVVGLVYAFMRTGPAVILMCFFAMALASVLFRTFLTYRGVLHFSFFLWLNYAMFLLFEARVFSDYIALQRSLAFSGVIMHDALFFVMVTAVAAVVFGVIQTRRSVAELVLQ